ncbi:MAG: anion permease [Candidatus Heimdallarchaeota archaeon]|nr:MAG: anion permease [Candidatus Heimdallarchaeota archaeon]
MVIFSLVFIVAFLLVAKYHHEQLTIILVSCLIVLTLAIFLLEDFTWNNVVDHYIEWEVLAVVFGMSLLVETISDTGLFDWLIIRILKISKGEVFPLFVLTFILTILLSSVLANVTAMILVGSMIITTCKGLDYDPTPFILGAVLATDLAGMSTVVSSLPAILVGAKAEIGFIEFLVVSLPFVVLSIPLCIFYLKKFFPPEKIPLKEKSSIDTQMILSLDPWVVVDDITKFRLAFVSLAITIIGFALAQPMNIPIGVVAISGGIIAIVLTRPNEHELIGKLNWSALLLFAGLFILVGTLEETEVLIDIAHWLKEISGGDLFLSGILILIITGFFSGLLDNIPVTAALIPVVEDMNTAYIDSNPRYLWFILVFSGALGGGWTPFGSAAGILAVSFLAKKRRPLEFKTFVLCLLPISVVLLILSGIYLSILALAGFI